MRPDPAACYGQERLPRYTSSPTAPHFSSAVGPATYAEWLRAIPRHAQTSLYLHVLSYLGGHQPRCASVVTSCSGSRLATRRGEVMF